ncbi:hypothetical protein [Sulfodiicoccus acidiphilus]|nr:hypothetical protein [Sulfodiicoccus acidiphilus]
MWYASTSITSPIWDTLNVTSIAGWEPPLVPVELCPYPLGKVGL